MLLKNTLCITLFTLTGLTVFAQETIDARVVKNRGKQAEQAFIHNKNSYNYYLFELDKSHYVVPVSQLTPKEQSQLLPASGYTNSFGEAISMEAVDSETFNFYDYGIRLQKEHRQYIALNENKAIVFYSIPELSQLFKNSEFNTK